MTRRLAVAAICVSTILSSSVTVSAGLLVVAGVGLATGVVVVAYWLAYWFTVGL
jgi:hypothetical protein